tara:strand:+ start:451 stop:1812 length:1362 start_codon:yes stop_codon:yes gene_type:complete
MATNVEIAYYNSIVLAGGSSAGLWHVEESRIKGEFNGASMDYGAKAYTTDIEYGSRRRSNAMMYSGIYNSKTKVNKTNEFPIGAAITRAVDIADGSIQKLYAEDNDLNIFQENKVSRALIDKDAIYTAEGGNLTVRGSQVIGQVVPYLGKYGISKDPESFAYFGGRSYYVDRNRGVVLRLSRNGQEVISRYGMTDFFKDNLALSEKVFGMYDEDKNQYIVSLQGANINIGKKSNTSSASISTSNTTFATLGFQEKTKGWISLYSYKPKFGVSLQNKFFTFNAQNIYKHYDSTADYNRYYDTQFKDPSYVKLVMNDVPSSIKSFLTINYEGSTGWSMESGRAEDVNRNTYTISSQAEQAYKIPKKGVTIVDENNMQINVGFELKESKYYKELRQNLPYVSSNYTAGFNRNTFNKTTGIKGYHAVFEMQYYEPSDVTGETKAELFAVSNEINISS